MRVPKHLPVDEQEKILTKLLDRYKQEKDLIDFWKSPYIIKSYGPTLSNEQHNFIKFDLALDSLQKWMLKNRDHLTILQTVKFMQNICSAVAQMHE